VIDGSVGGCCNAVAVTGYPAGFSDSNGTVYDSSYPGYPASIPAATEIAAQTQLGIAMTALLGMTSGASEATLDNITLGPGVYSVSATNLNTILTLDGGGNANALWVFQFASALTTASSSQVILKNTGAGAGVYWVLGSSGGTATLGASSTFVGNILAYAAITVGTTATDSCGRLLTQTESVSLDGTDTIGIGTCSGILAGSDGLSGGGTLGEDGKITLLPPSNLGVPEPGTVVLLGAGIACLVARRPRSARGRQRDLASRA
jgi:hypothetical protein